MQPAAFIYDPDATIDIHEHDINGIVFGTYCSMYVPIFDIMYVTVSVGQ